MAKRARRKRRLRALGKILFCLYIAFMIYFLIFSDWYGRAGTGGYRYNLVLFKEIRRFWAYRDSVGLPVMLMNLAGNVLIFVPFGFFLPMASRHRSFFTTLFASLGFSLCVEIFQFLTQVGSLDVDDLFLNTLGGVLGYCIFSIGAAVRRKK